jgi:threonine/homoserine/homoserine lactone efflux protein
MRISVESAASLCNYFVFGNPGADSLMIAAFITGLVMSFVGSMIPTGPIALIVLKRGLGRQKLSALSLVAGAALAEATYALVAYLGINLALSRYPLQTSILRMIVGGILIAFAAVCIFNDHPSRKKITGRDYPGANFLLGLSIAGLNPTFLITWAGAIAAARAAGLISGIHAAPGFALGVIVGPVLWFWILLKILARHAEFLSPQTIKIIEKALPIALLILAGVILAQAIIPLL